MSIFTKPISRLETADVQELVQDKAVENIRLEFKTNVPDKDETLKKLSSFANSFGGFMVVGAKAKSTDGRIEDLPGVDEQAGLKQKMVQWCFDAVSPPLIVEVSDAIPTPSAVGRFCYVIYTAESDAAPHFLNGRKGVWIRTDEFSQRYEPQLATENEIRNLLDRRRLTIERRTELGERSRRRFEQFLSRRAKGPTDAQRRKQAARLELSVGPRFPCRPVCTQTTLVQAFNNCRLAWRGVSFPRDTATFVSQHESVLRLAPDEPEMMVEATIWGMLFYATLLAIERNLQQTSFTGIHLYGLVGYLLVFIEHAGKMLSGWPYEGPLSIDVEVGGILGVPWLYVESGGLCQGPVSELDDVFSFSLPTTTDALRKQPDALVISMLQNILFGMNWAHYASDSSNLEALVRNGYRYNLWANPTALRI
jgi:hypothetical protein